MINVNIKDMNLKYSLFNIFNFVMVQKIMTWVIKNLVNLNI